MSEHLLDGSDVPIGEIWVETAGMPAETFTEADARAVRTLVDHYGLNLHVHRDVDPEHPETYLLTEAVEPPVLVDNPTSVQVLIYLDLDVQTMWMAPEKLTPAHFQLDLCKLLASISVRHTGADPLDYMIEMSRKGHSVGNSSGRPAWADYEALVRL